MGLFFFVCFVGVDNGLIPMMPSQDGIPPPDPLRLDWPKVTKNILLIIFLNFFIFDLFCQRVNLMCNLLTSTSGPGVDQPSGQFVHAGGEWSVALGAPLHVRDSAQPQLRVHRR